MIPYVELREIDLGQIVLPVFPMLILIALVTGYMRGVRRARRLGTDLKLAGAFAFWVIACGFAGAFLLKLAYQPELFQHTNWLIRYRFSGIASFGGLFGGLLAGIGFLWIRNVRVEQALGILDVVAYICPLSWAIGRVGCALVHDHPGIRSTSWLAVKYPDWPRYDLGLLGLIFLLVLSGLFGFLDRRQHAPGFFLSLGCLLTGAFRFWLDGLHVDPPRYFGWTVDQYSSILLLTCGAVVMVFLIRKEKALDLAHMEA